MRTLYTGISCPDPSFVHTPMIEVRPVSNDKGLRQAASEVNICDYLLFTSRFAVKFFVPYIATESWPASLRVVSIGATTTATLRQAGFERVEQTERDNSHGVVSWFSRQKRGRVLIPRSNLALSIIPEGLRRLGYDVTTVTAYENRMPDNPQKVDLDSIDRIVFTSPSTVDNFIRLYGCLPADKLLCARGPVTEQHIQSIIHQ